MNNNEQQIHIKQTKSNKLRTDIYKPLHSNKEGFLSSNSDCFSISRLRINRISSENQLEFVY